ncbi:MAG: DUF1629 domain-containing protein [Pseudomonadota bacterium]
MTEWREVDEPKIWASRFPRYLDLVSFDWTCSGKRLEFVRGFRNYLKRIEEGFPTALFFETSKKIPTATQDAFKIIDGLRVISPALHDILVQFDMDGVQFFEVPIHADEHGTPTDLPNHYVLNVYGAKNALIPELSENIMHPQLAGDPEPLRTDIWRPNKSLDVVALQDAAASGPDLWRDPKYKDTLFFSDRLKRAIDAARLKTKALDFAPTRVFTKVE